MDEEFLGRMRGAVEQLVVPKLLKMAEENKFDLIRIMLLVYDPEALREIIIKLLGG